MPAPTIISRADHAISRRNIDSEALKVLYRLHESRHTAYLVGGSVRDLLLGRRPKDFDIGTDAHPYQIKKLFRNCWIIGRRFRLAHIKFGPKTIEVATFRKNVPDIIPEELAESEGSAVGATSPEPVQSPTAEIIHRDNTFGTPEEDAFRRDFTINGLFYDISTFSVIDYVGGLEDLERRTIRSIGDPRVRFVEDPVRMLRAAVFAARLDFTLDPLVEDAIAEHRSLILKASPARLLEEYYKILRSGYAEATFRALSRTRLLELMTPELRHPSDKVWDSLARLDSYRRQFQAPPPELTTSTLIGALLRPLGIISKPRSGAADHPLPDRVSFGALPVARRDIERLHQVSQMLPRLLDEELPPRVTRTLTHRPSFADALLWVEIFEDAPESVVYWKRAHAERGPAEPGAAVEPGQAPTARRRRRRRRRGGGGNGPPPEGEA